MRRPMTLDEIIGLYERRGARRYGGETVSQLEHALQCAALAEEAGATRELVAACVLHDLGHLLSAHSDEVDEVHQYVALPLLRPLFSEAVLEPVKLHVDAKRYLCRVDSGYWDSLSRGSKRSLELQGGVFTPNQANEFLLKPYASEAVKLRRYDDLAKVPARPTPGLAHYAELLQ